MINTYLQNNALDSKTAEAVRNYIADYKSMKDKVVAMQMEMQGGKMGRGSAQAFKAIADQIPNGATPDSKTATHQLANLQETQTELMSKYPEHYQNYTKATPYQAKAKAAEAHVPGGQASGLKEGATGTGNDGKKYVVKGGKWQAK
jgi:hypothetical protein